MLLSADNQIAAHYCGRDAIDQLYSRAYATKCVRRQIYTTWSLLRSPYKCFSLQCSYITRLAIVSINKTLRE